MVLEKIGKTALPLPAFLRACETARLPLTGPGLVGLAVMAFQEVKAAFRERLKPHAHLTEYELTAADCHVVRDNFSYQKFDEFTFPFGRFATCRQITGGDFARRISLDRERAASRRRHFASLHVLELPRSRRPFPCSSTEHLAANHFFISVFLPLILLHTRRCGSFDALPEQAIFASPQRGNPRWRSVPPARAEVFIEEDGDVALRASGQYLGSFARNWIIPLGFHPFQFGAWAPQTPRLLCGRVIVQRRSLDGLSMRKWALEISPGFRANSFSRSKVCAPRKIGRVCLYSSDGTGIAAQWRRRPR